MRSFSTPPLGRLRLLPVSPRPGSSWRTPSRAWPSRPWRGSSAFGLGGAPLTFGHRLRRPLRGRASASGTSPAMSGGHGSRLPAKAGPQTYLPAPLQGRGAGLRPHSISGRQSPQGAPACVRKSSGSPDPSAALVSPGCHLDRVQAPHRHAPRPPVAIAPACVRASCRRLPCRPLRRVQGHVKTPGCARPAGRSGCPIP
jgi:hypothetical protein